MENINENLKSSQIWVIHNQIEEKKQKKKECQNLKATYL
jgi:hypothetical protein